MRMGIPTVMIDFAEITSTQDLFSLVKMKDTEDTKLKYKIVPILFLKRTKIILNSSISLDSSKGLDPLAIEKTTTNSSSRKSYQKVRLIN